MFTLSISFSSPVPKPKGHKHQSLVKIYLLQITKITLSFSQKNFLGASLLAQMVKSPPTVQETQVRFLGQEDPLVEGMATHASILAWRIPWTEEPGGLQSMGSQSQTQLSD